MTDRRITEYAVADGPEAEAAAEIATTTHFGILDGVEVDFRHPLLPVTDWHASSFWHVWGDGPHQAGVIFPSEAERGSIEDARQRKYIPDTFPTIIVNAGDKLTIADVIINEDDRIFDHQHDKESRYAILQITRRDGSIEVLHKPMVFHGATRLRNGSWRHQFDNVIDRIKHYVGEDNLSGVTKYSIPVPLGAWALPAEEQAYFAAYSAHKGYFDLYDAIEALDVPNKVAMQACLQGLANSAAMASFLLGKIEARRADQIASKTVNGGKRLGLSNANQYWVEEAERLWKENPQWTLNKIAKTISLGDENDKRSIMKARGVVLACPKTSSSWEGCQKKINENRW